MNILKSKNILKLSILLVGMTFAAPKLEAQSIPDAIKNEELLKFQAARSIYNLLLAKDANNAEVYYHLGMIAYNNFQFDSAKFFFNKGLQLNANEPLNLVGTGLMKIHDDNKAGAKQDFDKALSQVEKSPNEKIAYVCQQIVNAIWLEQDAQDADYAFGLANKAVQLDPKNLRVKISLGDAYLVKGDGGAGIRQYESVQDLDPKYLLAQLKVGHCYASPSAKNYQAAIEVFNKIIAQDPNYPPVYPELGEAYFSMGNLDKAKESYEKFLSLVGNSPAERLRYAELLYFAKDYKDALVQLNKAYEGLSDNVVLLRLKAICETELGQYSNGLKSVQMLFQKAKPAQLQAIDYEYYGRTLIHNNQDSLGVMNLNKAYKEDSTKKYLLDTIAANYAKTKQYDKAAKVIEHKIALSAGNVDPQDYYNLGRYYLVQARYKDADTIFARVVIAYPTWPVGYYYRAVCNSNIDSSMKSGAAKPFYEKFLGVVGKDSMAYKAQVIEAYTYLVSYYYNRKDYVKAKEYILKLKAYDPENKQNNMILKYIDEINKKKK